MKREDIIRMAEEAGMTPITHASTADVICSRDSLVRFANLVAAAEREACAELLDEMAAKDKLTNYYTVAALAIRERGAP